MKATDGKARVTWGAAGWRSVRLVVPAVLSLGAAAALGPGAPATAAVAAKARQAPALRPDIVISEAHDTTHTRLDLRRVAFGLAPDHRLRARISMFSAWANSDLFAGSGPPGSVCLRLWSSGHAPLAPADYLVCATVAPDAKTLHGEVLANRRGLARRVASANVVRPTPRSVILRFGQSAVGRPARLSFAVESTVPGCVTASCVDVLPEGRVGVLVLRRGPTAHAGR
ncbi:MAG TPA: hypothetical protein VGN69_04415 [Solirubrobacteraceae bacterium]|jgi:hypothetical protein|nr:hypothetical protein [Solirubrobacteraceae bacterium]